MMYPWTESIGCRARVHCATCRDRSEAGRRWRESIARHFALPGDAVNFDCPFGVPWGAQAQPAAQAAASAALRRPVPPGRKDLRGCAGCRKKMLEKMKEGK